MLTVFAFLAAIPVSLIVGWRLYGKYASIQLLAGLLTLKPFLALPLWSFVLHIVEPGKTSNLVYLWTALPDVGLTLLLVLGFHKTIFAQDADARLAWVLLLLDTLRWGSILLGFFSPNDSSGFAITLGLAMPLIFALVAWGTCGDRY